MKILLIDNYDSFTFNLYHYLSSLRTKVEVIRNDKITSKEIIKKNMIGWLYPQDQETLAKLATVLI